MADALANIKKRSITALHPGATVYEKSVALLVQRSPRWHSKAAATVSLDTAISELAFRVYCVMGLKTKNRVSTVGVRKLGRLLGRDASTISRKIKELVKNGHLEPLPHQNGCRAQYRFTSAAFHVKCRTCKRYMKELGEDGQCWLCAEKEGKRKA